MPQLQATGSARDVGRWQHCEGGAPLGRWPGAVVTRIQTKTGDVGYRHQLDRARRFLERVLSDYEGLEDINEIEFQDMMWSFFQHCWHIKDWLRNDPLASEAQKQVAIDMAHPAGGALLICRDLCNGTKHLRLKDPSSGTGAAHLYVDMNIVPERGRFEGLHY
jgi:hypothetical protein